mmetsp:Transcript_61776/g.194878  ORF Transcript_61776/g.194878 Transcript_61776/m.194878 type:complete len:455 (-) Transcript_61776:140-1504(-)
MRAFCAFFVVVSLSTLPHCHSQLHCEEDDLSLLSLTAQVHTRSSRKDRPPQEQPPQEQPPKEQPPQEQPPQEQAEAPQPPTEQAPAEEEPPARRGEQAAGAAAAPPAEVPRYRPPRRKAASRPEPPPEDPAAEELSPDEKGEVAGAYRPGLEARSFATAARARPPFRKHAIEAAEEYEAEEAEEDARLRGQQAEVYSRTYHRKHPPASAVTETPEQPVELPTETPEEGLPAVFAARLGEAGGRAGGDSHDRYRGRVREDQASWGMPDVKGLAGGTVEVPVPLLLFGVVLLTGLGAFLMHEITERCRRTKGLQLPKAAVQTPPPAQPSIMDSSFLFHVLNSVKRNNDAPPPNIVNKGPALPVPEELAAKLRDDSSDDCSTCPRPVEKEPESEFDECEEVLGKLREADWALQIAYFEALQRRNDSSGPKHQARSSRRQMKAEALAAGKLSKGSNEN